MIRKPCQPVPAPQGARPDKEPKTASWYEKSSGRHLTTYNYHLQSFTRIQVNERLVCHRPEVVAMGQINLFPSSLL